MQPRCCQKDTKPVSQECGAALSARRTVSERRTVPRSCWLPETIIAQTRRPISSQRPHASSWQRRQKLQGFQAEPKWEKRCDDGGRGVKPGLKHHQQSGASNNRMHLKLNHMLPVKFDQCPQEGRPRWESH